MQQEFNNELTVSKPLAFKAFLFEGQGVKNVFKNRSKKLKLSLTNIKYKAELNAFTKRMALIGVAINAEMLGVLEWPYIHNEWDVANRLDRIAQHYEIVSNTFPKLSSLDRSNFNELLNLSMLSEGVSVVIDRPIWFAREGELVINIFKGDLRVASIAFSMAYQDKEVVTYLGAIQGIHKGIPSDESLNIFRSLTKDFYGLRPRSLLLELVKVISKKLGAKRVLGIADQHRHHRHPYFGTDKAVELKADYNSIWEEHGGKLIKSIGFYDIPIMPAIKDMSLIPSKKRAQYKRRYEFIKSIGTAVHLHKLH